MVDGTLYFMTLGWIKKFWKEGAWRKSYVATFLIFWQQKRRCNNPAMALDLFRQFHTGILWHTMHCKGKLVVIS